MNGSQRQPLRKIFTSHQEMKNSSSRGGAGNVLGSKCKNNRRGGLPSDGWPLHRSCNDVNKEITVAIPGGGVLPYKRLVGLCRWMGWHFHDWIDYYGVAFLIESLECGRTFLF